MCRRALVFSALLAAFLCRCRCVVVSAVPQTMQQQDAVLAHPHVVSLFKRQTCPTGYDSCSNVGYAEACCSTTASCTTDENHNAACCPTGAKCTGTLYYGTATTTITTSQFAFNNPTTASNTATTTTTTTTTTVQSTVTNSYFPFLYIATTFSNAAACSSAYYQCQSEYASCTSSLAGGALYGVTISVDGAGVTVVGSTPSSVAVSICSSLSSKGCYGLETTNCATFGTAAATATTTSTRNAALPTRPPDLKLYGIGIGLALGAAGNLI